MNVPIRSVSAVAVALGIAACSERPVPVASEPGVMGAQVSQIERGRYIVVFGVERVVARALGVAP